MEKINLKNDLKVDLKLEKIWSDRYKENEEIIAPLYQIEVLKNEVTFLSINPSLN